MACRYTRRRLGSIKAELGDFFKFLNTRFYPIPQFHNSPIPLHLKDEILMPLISEGSG
jgi:hypothetical protein